MRKYLIIGFLVLGLLMLGCMQNTETGNEGNSSGSTPSSGTSSSGTSSGGSGSSSSSSAQGPNLTGLKYNELLSLDIPIECQVNETTPVSSSQITLKIKGKKVRGEGISTRDGMTTPSVLIIDGNTIYVKLSPAEAERMKTNCEWIKLPATEKIDLAKMMEAPETTYTCAPAAFGDEVFVPSGRVCNLLDIAGITS